MFNTIHTFHKSHRSTLYAFCSRLFISSISLIALRSTLYALRFLFKAIHIFNKSHRSTLYAFSSLIALRSKLFLLSSLYALRFFISSISLIAFSIGSRALSKSFIHEPLFMPKFIDLVTDRINMVQTI